MQKNVAGQKWVVFAFQDEGGANPGEPVTGDAANITANLRLDGGAANAVDDTNPTELEDGYYIFDLTQAETNAENIVICPASSTANVNVIGCPAAVYTTPANFPDLSVAATTGRVDVASIEGSDATDQINAACDAAIETYGLDHLVAASVTGTDVVDNSIIAKIVSSSATADWDDFVNTTDSLQANRDALPTTTSNPFILVDTTIATLASQTSFTLTAGSADDDAYNDCVIVITDQSTSTQKAVGRVSDYVGSTRTITLEVDPGVFTMATGDSVAIAAADKGVAAILDDTGTSGVVVAAGSKTGYALSATGLDLVIPADPDSTLPTLGTSSLPAWIGCFAAVMINEANATSNQISIRNTGDSADLITYASITDDGTTLTVPAGS